MLGSRIIQIVSIASLVWGLCAVFINTAGAGTYVGDRDNFGRFHGKGTYAENNGDSYVGDWVNGEKSGKGAKIWASGEKYTGEWLGDAPTGKGVKVFVNGEKYVGEFVDGKMSGSGSYYYLDQSKYIGDWLDGLPHGNGVKTSADTAECSGRFKLGVMWGEGSCRYTDGSYYEGSFREDLAHGNGLMQFANGVRYEGQWKEGKRHGEGELKYPSGGLYVGGWMYGLKNGKGSLRYSNGDLYEGGWALGDKSGQGIFVTEGGTRYEGQWLNGMRQGMGILTSVDGQVFHGLFSKNQKNGLGQCSKDGETWTCRYEKDNLIPMSGRPLAPQGKLQSKLAQQYDVINKEAVFYFEHNFGGDGVYRQAKNSWWQKNTSLLNNKLTITASSDRYFISIVIEKYLGPGTYTVGKKSGIARVDDSGTYYSANEDPGKVVIVEEVGGLINGFFEFNAYARGKVSAQNVYRMKNGRFSLKARNP